jgi:hypothetical protein
MSRMRHHYLAVSAGLVLALMGLSLAPASGLLAQSSASGALEFEARVQPSGGRLEPARSLSFYLLRKSVVDIEKEAEAAEPPADLPAFIDSLSVSPELKAWMKKNDTISLKGTDFVKELTADDITGVPEFLNAYMNNNGASLNAGLPAPKYKESDRESDPEKYQHAREQYLQAIRRYFALHPESLEGIDIRLTDVDPTQSWIRLQAEQRRKIERRLEILAQATYLAAQVDTDLDGRASLRNLAPGTYWLTTLGTPAMAGDARLLWDVPVTVQAGRTAHVELNNLNAMDASNWPPR